MEEKDCRCKLVTASELGAWGLRGLPDLAAEDSYGPPDQHEVFNRSHLWHSFETRRSIKVRETRRFLGALTIFLYWTMFSMLYDSRVKL